MLGTRACLAAWANFAFFGDEPPQNVDEFVINVHILIGAELADLRF
jgi:hypothetical protein